MNIAIMFHGHLRCYRDNTTIVPHLLERYPDADIFLQTFNVRNFAGKKWHPDDGYANEPVTRADMVWLASAYGNVVASVITDMTCGGDALSPAHSLMGFRVAKEIVCRMRQDYEALAGKKYDVVLLARYDLGFETPFSFPDTIAPDTLYGGYNANQERMGFDGEVFLYAAPSVMDACMTPAIPPELADNVEAWGMHGEQLMTAARKLRGFKYEPHYIRHFLYRSGGGITRVEA